MTSRQFPMQTLLFGRARAHRWESLFAPLVAIVAAVATLGCGPSNTDDGEPIEPTVLSLVLSPADAEVLVLNGVADPLAYTVTATWDDGRVEDVNSQVGLTTSNLTLGGFSNSNFVASGISSGEATISAQFMDAMASGSLTVRLQNDRVATGAPANSPEIFDAATEAASLAPTIVYPTTGTFVPPNLGDFESHWLPAAGTDLFRIRMATEFSETTVYTLGNIETVPPPGGVWEAFAPSEWTPAGNSARGGSMIVTIAALSTASPSTFGSAGVQLDLAEDDINGGIYYWASSGSQPAGIYRHDMARPGEAAEPFFTVAETPGGRCVACHVISRDGTTMAVTFDGGNRPANAAEAGIVDVETLAVLSPLDGTMKWNFATFTPDGSELLTVLDGIMTLRNPATGAILSNVEGTTFATHPEFSPQGDRLVYVEVATPNTDWVFTGGQLITRTYEQGVGFGPAVPIASAIGSNYYYPSWSPDGRWIVFNGSTEDAYDDISAELFIVRSDGTAAPIKLDSPNITTGLTNSWARYAPFEQMRNGEPLQWLTFSSKRPFGIRTALGVTPQIWMAPLFPDRIGAGDPSGPAFRLPFQELTTNNHIAQWTEKIIVVD